MKKTITDSETLIQRDRKIIRQTVQRKPLCPVEGNGSWLVDTEGGRYLDFFTGHGVMCLGYSHKALVSAMKKQIEALIHTGNHFHLEPQIRLAEKLSHAFFDGQVMFANSGAEIVELSIKLCRRRIPQKKQPRIICMEGSFHGRTYGALTATGQDYYKQKMGPFLSGLIQLPYNDCAALEKAADSSLCGILLEPILGEGGIIPASSEFIACARNLCDRYNALLVFDEIQTGMGRTGTLFGYSHYDQTPDVLLLAKPLGGGLPLSALIAAPGIASDLGIGDHGSTFGGNPVAAAAGIALFDIVSADSFNDEIKRKGKLIKTALLDLQKKYPDLVKDVRGRGMLLGMELYKAAAETVENALSFYLIINNPIGEVLRFLPPYTVSNDEITLFSKKLDAALNKTRKGLPDAEI